MPAYFNIEFILDKNQFSHSFLRKLYDNLFFNSFQFDSVYEWGCPPNLSLREITEWNTIKLLSGFELGYDEDVSNDYRQFLLSHPNFESIRVITIGCRGSILIIIPEDEIFYTNELESNEIYISFSEEKIQILKDLAINIWNTGFVKSIQTYYEIGEATEYDSILDGELPSITPFAIVDKECFIKINKKDFNIIKIANGSLIEHKRLN